MFYKAVIEVLVEADTHGEACDAIAEALRPICRKHASASSFIDWQYHEGSNPVEDPTNGEDFEWAYANIS
jgi:hypothetical protein